MDIRYGANQRDFQRYMTPEIRKEFLIDNIFRPDEATSVYSHIDRMVTLGIMPVDRIVNLEQNMDVQKSFGTNYFLERRELGIFNLGGAGRVLLGGGRTYEMEYKDCLYLTRGNRDVCFQSMEKESPAKFYIVSAPAHCGYENRFLHAEDAVRHQGGSFENSNERVIQQFIHPDIMDTCQLSMGITTLEKGSVWNTMPAHTHERRMEIYFYFELPENERVFHMMGEKDETRHIVIKNEQAVISPSRSIHSGVGTSNYSFIWAMGGENRAFDDMDMILKSDLM